MSELLGFDLDTSLGALPLSIKRWITIGRGMLTRPGVLVLGESSAALDFESTERLFRKIRELKVRGIGIMIVTHRIAELVRIADRATVLLDARSVGTLEAGQITEETILPLIAEPERECGRADSGHAARQSDHPVMRVTEARVCHDGASFDFMLCPGEIVGAKLDLYRNLRNVAGRGNAVVFLSSEIEEFENLCSRVPVFRGGNASSRFAPPFDSHVILNATFGRCSAAIRAEFSAQAASAR